MQSCTGKIFHTQDISDIADCMTWNPKDTTKKKL